MSCEDIPSLLDLQKVKKHADDFGRLMGTGIGTSTNGVTGQVRPTFNKVVYEMNSEFDTMIGGMNNEFDSQILNMGFTRIGTFAAGATLTNPRQTLLWDIADGGDGQEYGWSGSFPLICKVVPPGSTPLTTGGIAVGAWMSRFDPELRVQVREALRRSYAEAGYTLNGSFSNVGIVVSTITDVVLWDPTGAAYSYSGALPHTISAGESPVGNSNWVDKSHSILNVFLTAEMFGAKGNDPAHDDGPAINAMITKLIDTQIPGRLLTKTYYAHTKISHTSDSLGFELIGPGIEQCKIVRGDYSGSCISIYRKNGLKISGITADNRWHSGNDNPGVAWDFAHLQNADLGWLRGENCASYAGWVISGDDTITNNNVNLHDCIGFNTGGSGWQIQGARKSGHTRNKALNCGGGSTETGTGINFKVPVEDCWHLDCYAENIAGMGCSIGSSFPGVYAKRISFRGFRSQNVGIGMRLGEVEDSTADDMYFDLSGLSTDPLLGSVGHGVLLVDGARRNKISARVNKVANSRGVVTTQNATGNTVIIDGVTNPVAGATLVSFDVGSSQNEVLVRKGSALPTTLRSDAGTGNVLEFEGQPYAQGQTFISSGNLALHHAKVVSVLMDTEATAPTDDLVTITPGAPGQTITITINLNARVVTVKHGNSTTNGILLAGGVDFVMDNTRKILQLAWNSRSSQWIEVGRMAT